MRRKKERRIVLGTFTPTNPVRRVGWNEGREGRKILSHPQARKKNNNKKRDLRDVSIQIEPKLTK